MIPGAVHHAVVRRLAVSVAAITVIVTAARVPDGDTHERVGRNRQIAEPVWRRWAAGGHWMGDTLAQVVIVHFCDLTCGNCANFARYVDSLRVSDPDVAVVFKHALLVADELTLEGAAALTCADRLDAFDRVYGELFRAGLEEGTIDDLVDLAKRSGVAWRPFLQCTQDPAVLESARRDARLASRIGVDRTPVLLINGRVLMGNPTLARLRRLIDEARRGANPTG